ncbi:MAG: alpha/beta fold hydrolase [Lentisphaerae bacterium]|nr:alpha/beta fold hydrolase [Lentisphaerota bacterium]MCP4102241.1 alpha/beta fold hydrolase [Lentisphaerota bacterium]
MLDLLTKYAAGKKCHFYFTPDSKKDCKEAVVLVHGLMRRSSNMYGLGKWLANQGYRVYVYDYQTSQDGIAGHGQKLRKYLKKVCSELPEEMPLHMVTHSMGGIITRYALAKSQDDDLFDSGRINRIVMLGPPHGGSDLARFAAKYLPFTVKMFQPIAELSSEAKAAVHDSPVIEGPEVGVVAGKYDLQVSVKYTFMPGIKDHIVLKSEHSLMMKMPHVRDACLEFLQKGKFSPHFQDAPVIAL